MLYISKFFIIFGICWAAPQQGTKRPIPPEADVYFTISATHLRGKANDPDGKVDPYVIVYFATNMSENSTSLLGTSETLENDNNPEWNTVFKIKHIRSTNQIIHLLVRDYDLLNDDDAMGYASIPIDDFLTRGEYTTHLSNSLISGITVKPTTPIYLDLTLRGIPLQDNFEGASDLYVMCYRRSEGLNFLFHTTFTIKNAEEATFTYIPFLNYRRGASQKLHFEVFDYDTFSPDDLVGSVDLAVDPLVESGHSAIFSLGGPATMTVSLSRDN